MYAEAGITQYRFFPYISQLPHGALPACALKNPAEHASHGPPSGPLYPASHAQLVLAPTELEWAGHAGVCALLDGVLALDDSAIMIRATSKFDSEIPKCTRARGPEGGREREREREREPEKERERERLLLTIHNGGSGASLAYGLLSNDNPIHLHLLITRAPEGSEVVIAAVWETKARKAREHRYQKTWIFHS